MSRKKNRGLPIWVSKASDNKFVPLSHSMLTNANFMKLKNTTLKTYIYMRDYSNGAMEFIYPHRLYKNVVSKGSFNSSIKELEEYGFIDLVDSGKFNKHENKYRFSSRWQT